MVVKPYHILYVNACIPNTERKPTVPTKQTRCRICKKYLALCRFNRWRICESCQPEWEEKATIRRNLTKALKYAYEVLWNDDEVVPEVSCQICGREPKNRRLSVDHNHKTGEIRGLLCYHCNYALAWFKDDPQKLQAAIVYLSRKPKYFVREGDVVCACHGRPIKIYGGRISCAELL